MSSSGILVLSYPSPKSALSRSHSRSLRFGAAVARENRQREELLLVVEAGSLVEEVHKAALKCAQSKSCVL